MSRGFKARLRERERQRRYGGHSVVLLVVLEELILPHGVSASVCFASLRAAVPSMSREIPVIIKFTPTIDFCINNGIIGTGGIRLCPDRVEALIYWEIGASGLWLCKIVVFLAKK